ncbi:hypothetical protein R544_26380 [Salmonella enterica subsp. enterica serovar Gaminara]|nr:hypothetical protein R544_26380 [Salmonella enterica subsp. enterica serovar Gaminara]
MFVYSEVKDSPFNSPDKIMDFKSHIDKVDLSFFNKGENGHNFIKLVNGFSGQAGEATLTYNTNNNLSELALNIHGGSTPDFLVQIVGQVDVNTDFIV